MLERSRNPDELLAQVKEDEALASGVRRIAVDELCRLGVMLLAAITFISSCPIDGSRVPQQAVPYQANGSSDGDGDDRGEGKDGEPDEDGKDDDGSEMAE